jgi:hypothetical protein
VELKPLSGLGDIIVKPILQNTGKVWLPIHSRSAIHRIQRLTGEGVVGRDLGLVRFLLRGLRRKVSVMCWCATRLGFSGVKRHKEAKSFTLALPSRRRLQGPAVSKLLKRQSAVVVVVEFVERPLPRPSDEAYVETRLLEALGEARLALRFLEEGLTRNAACKAYQAWRALLAALLRLELDKLKALAKTGEERRWLESKAVPRVPTSRMVALSLLLEKAGHEAVTAWTSMALDIHDYQYHGPDPDMALSKFRNREEAAEYTRRLAAEVARRVEALRGRVRWGDELEKELGEVRGGLGALKTLRRLRLPALQLRLSIASVSAKALFKVLYKRREEDQS